MIVRDAIEQDALLAIYNEVIATSTAVYMDEPTTLGERLAWWHGRVAAGYPVLVSEGDSGATGFASFGDFRPRAGYRFIVEHGVYVRADQRGRGIGQALMTPLLDRAVSLRKHVIGRGRRCGERGLAALPPAPRLRTGGALQASGLQVRPVARSRVPSANALTRPVQPAQSRVRR